MDITEKMERYKRDREERKRNRWQLKDVGYKGKVGHWNTPSRYEIYFDIKCKITHNITMCLLAYTNK